jgi:NAD(P)-dependent dehydrogenase (short-subunit alcohol dehydrogenase family)
MTDVVVVIGAGSIGQAIARRVSAGEQVLLADLRIENAKAAADVLSNAGFAVSTATVDVSSRDSILQLVEVATKLGEVTGVIHAAGVSPSQASPATILKVDLYGTAVVLEEFGKVIGSRRRGRRHRVAVRASLGRADRGAGQGARDDARRSVAVAPAA